MRGRKRPLPSVFVVPGLQRAGAENQVLDLVNGLDPGRFDKTLFTFQAEVDQADRIQKESVVHIAAERKFRLDVRPLFRLAATIRRRRAKVVHCTLKISMLFGFLACRMAGTGPSLVAAVHTTLNRSHREAVLDRLLYRWVLAACDRVIFVCRRQQDHWTRKHPFLERTSAVVYNGIDPNRFDPAPFVEEGMRLRRRLSIPSSAPVVACVAAFRPEKGHDLLVPAFGAMNTPESPYLILAGDGERRSKIEAMVSAAGLSDRVFFLGPVADVRPVLAAADATVLASTAVETFSLAMLESMSMETPVVGTRIGGLEEAVLHGETGAVVAPGDSEALRDALERMLADPVRLRRMGRVGRDRVRKHFSRTRMIRETAALLERCANRE